MAAAVAAWMPSTRHYSAQYQKRNEVPDGDPNWRKDRPSEKRMAGDRAEAM